jgi:hypothetical protein
VNVCMTISTACAGVLEDQAGVALHATDFCVHAAKRIAGLVMIELGVRSNRFPVRVRMAVLARNRNRAVGIGDLSPWGAILWRLTSGCVQEICARDEERQETECR